MENELNPCDICKLRTFRVVRRSKITKSIHEDIYSSSSNHKLTHQLVRCTNCGCVQVNPGPTQEFLTNEYSQAIDTIHSQEDKFRIRSFSRVLAKLTMQFDDKDSSFVNYQQIEQATAAAAAPPLVRPRKLLDVGCAGGEFLFASKLYGFEVLGIEPSQNMVETAKNKFSINVVQGTLETIHFDSQSFDVVTLMDVLEHVQSPHDTLKTCNQILRDDGIIILNLPMVDTISAILLRRFWPFYLNVHLYYFSKKTIHYLLREAGFDIYQCNAYSQTLSFGYIVRRFTGMTLPSKFFAMPLRYWSGQRTIFAKKSVVKLEKI